MANVPAVLDDEEGRLVLSEAIADAVERFGPRLVSAHLLGSLAHEGFVAAVSDVAVAYRQRLIDEGLEHLADALHATVARSGL